MKRWLIVWLTTLLPALSASELTLVVEIEEEVARCAPANNGAGPLWCYGAPLVVRQGSDVFVSALETGVGVPPLSNTRPRLYRKRGDGAWDLLHASSSFRHREPCPLVGLADGAVFLSLNPSLEPPGNHYGRCDPHLAVFAKPDAHAEPTILRPPWPKDATFTDHSYRGAATDRSTGELLVLNIDAATSAQHYALRDAKGQWARAGKIRFPLRACYPQVALRDGAAHVLAISDIVEPHDAWRVYKHAKTKQGWDYVFRRLFYAAARDLRQKDFSEPVEVESVDATAGHIGNQDLWIGPDGAAHILFRRQNVQSALLRDRFFPGTPLATSLVWVVLKDGKEVRRETLLDSVEGREGPLLGNSRFHAMDSQRLFVVFGVSGVEGGKPVHENRVLQLLPERGAPQRIPLQEPFSLSFTACERGGSAPSATLDLFGVGGNGERLRYARVRLGFGKKS